jgi:hypothetical protein
MANNNDAIRGHLRDIECPVNCCNAVDYDACFGGRASGVSIATVVDSKNMNVGCAAIRKGAVDVRAPALSDRSSIL